MFQKNIPLTSFIWKSAACFSLTLKLPGRLCIESVKLTEKMKKKSWLFSLFKIFRRRRNATDLAIKEVRPLDEALNFNIALGWTLCFGKSWRSHYFPLPCFEQSYRIALLFLRLASAFLWRILSKDRMLKEQRIYHGLPTRKKLRQCIVSGVPRKLDI